MKAANKLTIVLGVLLFVCTDLSAQQSNNLQTTDSQTNKPAMQQILIDKFSVPTEAKEEFVERLTINLDFLRTLPGLIETNAYEQTGGAGKFNYVTTAVWESEEALKNAKKIVKTEYQKQGFDPSEMFKRLNIKIDRAIYTKKVAVPQASEKNKTIVRRLYEECLNKRKFDMLNEFISKDYAGIRGETGSAGFVKPVQSLIQGFPDIQWNIKKLIGEGDKVVVEWEVQGTHTGSFRNITATGTGKTISNIGIGIYELQDGKIINAQIQTDRLGFLQQLGMIPQDLSTLAQPQE